MYRFTKITLVSIISIVILYFCYYFALNSYYTIKRYLNLDNTRLYLLEVNEDLEQRAIRNKEEIKFLKDRITHISMFIRDKIDIIKFEKINEEKFQVLNKNLDLTKFSTDFLNIGKHNEARGSAYLDIMDDNLFLMSGDGILGYHDLNERRNVSIEFKTIQTNIEEFITYERFYQRSKFGIKDILVFNENLYISFIKEYSKNCFTPAVVKGKINYNKINLQLIYEDENCINYVDDNTRFSAHQSGGRIKGKDSNTIIMTTGAYFDLDHPQSNDSSLGKLIEIDINNREYRILAKGMRNSQGLYYDKSKEIIVMSEHGPKGGDEINIYRLNDFDIVNYGWPISSYGDHYQEFSEKSKWKYEKAPLYKSHKDYGFQEPIKYFIPSIGTSEIIKINQKFMNNNEEDNNYFLGSLGNKIVEGDMSLHYISFDENYKNITFEEIIVINERVRDIVYYENGNMYILFLENSSSVGFLEHLRN
tara:strand:+ start:467 stop:1894 length:1428 start_codon:yes stop_codon:yes gene_type:complete